MSNPSNRKLLEDLEKQNLSPVVTSKYLILHQAGKIELSSEEIVVYEEEKGKLDALGSVILGDKKFRDYIILSRLRKKLPKSNLSPDGMPKDTQLVNLILKHLNNAR